MDTQTTLPQTTLTAIDAALHGPAGKALFNRIANLRRGEILDLGICQLAGRKKGGHFYMVTHRGGQRKVERWGPAH